MISVDTETNFTDRAFERYCLGISLTTDRDTYYIPVSHQKGWLGTPTNVPIPTDLFRGLTCPIIAHNMKFDLQVLRKIGVELPVGNLQDTMAMSHFVCEWNKGKDQGHKLEIVAPKYLGKTSQKEVAKAKAMKGVWEISPPQLMAQYAEQDARLLPELYKKLLSLMEPDWIRQWEEVDRDFMLLLTDMETLGIPIDRELSEKLRDKCSERLFQIERELGFDPAKPSQLHPKLFDPPPYGLGLTVPSRTPKTNEPQVRLEWLEANAGHRLCALVYEYRKTAKQMSSYFSAYCDLTTRDYARLHCDFRQYGTQTGRTSSADPNLQQIPREEYKDAKVKEVFNPEEGKQLWELDFRTLEYRMQAVYAKDADLINLFRNEEDFHQLIADSVNSQSGLSISRQQAKTVNYLMSFGGGIPVLDKKLGVGYKKAKQIHEAYKASLPLIFAKADQAQEAAERNNNEVKMWFGRKRHFRYPGETHKAFNAVIQGGGFEIVKRSMLKLWKAGFILSNQVHDSVWINVDSEDEAIEAQHLMEDWTEKKFGLRFSTDRKLMKK